MRKKEQESFQLSTNSQLVDIKKHEKKLQEALELPIIDVYKKLTAPQYMTDVQLYRVVRDSDSAINKVAQHYPDKIIATIVLIQGIVLLARKLKTAESNERRFTIFFHEYNLITSSYYKQFFSSYVHPAYHHWITDTLFAYYLKQGEISTTPWEDLLRNWMMMDQSPIRRTAYYQLLKEEQRKNKTNYSLTLLTSLLALVNNDGAHSIQLLRTIKDEMNPNDLVHHFLFLKQQKNWKTIQNWFELLQSKWNYYTLGQLKPIYDEMLMKTKTSKTEKKLFWESWLRRPSYRSFKEKIQLFAQEERNNAVSYLFSRLKQEASLLSTQIIYIQIARYEQRYMDGIDFLLRYETNPIQLHDEKVRFLADVKDTEPLLLIPLYHQFINRLIEKRSRLHYIESIHYMKELQQIYRLNNDIETFHLFIQKLKELYKTYRALIQEMNKLDGYNNKK